MAAQDSSAESSRAPATDTTVLFVDDESDMLDLYEALYGGEYEVLTAQNGTEAIEAFDERIDVAFFDRRMPGLSGDEVIERLRDRGYQTPMGIVSAIDPEVEPSVDHDAYLTKPVDREQIRDVVDQHAT